jgi:hypothetical protein
MKDLPLELHGAIAEKVVLDDTDTWDTTTLLALAQVSRAFQLESERLLYQNITLDTHPRLVKFCRTIRDIPRFRQFVFSLIINVHWHGMRVTTSYFPLLSLTLRRLTNLTTLLFPACAAEYGSVLRNCTFQLRRFTCAFNFDDAFASFLANQHELIGLHYQNKVLPCPKISPNTLPRLTVLDCHIRQCELVTTLYPHRPISHLRVDHDIGLRVLDKLGLSSVPLLGLSLVGTCPKPDTLNVLPEVAPDLEYFGDMHLCHGMVRCSSIDLS